MSEVKVNKISPRTACGTTTLGDSGDTFNVPCGSKINLASGGNLTVASGATITNNGTQTGFGRTGTVDWVTTPKVTGDSPVTGVSGNGYFMNTTAGAITLNLPAGAAGDIISAADYAATWQTNNLTITPNGSEKIGSVNSSVVLSTEGQSVTLVYVDSTQGWINTMDSTSNVRAADFLTATGGDAIVTCGDYKTHVFTGPGTFCVSKISTTTPENSVTYLVVAAGGGGGLDSTPFTRGAGGGGAGGFRLSNTTCLATPTMSPLVAPAGQTVTASPYSITVGGGGTAGTGTASPGVEGGRGGSSIFACITSTGGGGGGGHNPATDAPTVNSPGGSGGGNQGTGGTGNTPPVSPAQGTAGGDGGGAPTYAAGGGGGAIAAGSNGTGPGVGGAGGDGSYIADAMIGPTAPSYGVANPPVSDTRIFAGGGGAAGPSPTTAAGGAGGGAPGNAPASAGTINTGGGGGGYRSGGPGSPAAGLGGSGIVIIRYKYQ